MVETVAELGWSAKGPASTSFCYDGGLALFPLPLVLFPRAILPLQIFEFCYCIMMNTRLETDLHFGVVFSDASSVSGVSCVGEVIKHERLVDDRFFLICKGQEQFRITWMTRTKPYLVAEVAWLEDRLPSPGVPEEEGEDLEDVIRISNRLNGKAADKDEGTDTAAADLRRGLFSASFSFFVGSTFEGAPRKQQALLELQDTGARLRREWETLRNTLNYCFFVARQIVCRLLGSRGYLCQKVSIGGDLSSWALLSDMQAFKRRVASSNFKRYRDPFWAANDVGWFTEPLTESLMLEVQGKQEEELLWCPLLEGQQHGNLWRELWETAKPLPAAKQAPLFDEDLAVEPREAVEEIKALDIVCIKEWFGSG
ncbi:hypothetical protein Taro_045008 [Colocasia esculenta]|uniref:Lon N-terminal domain-containing protein n=1 Tax=Colocasia esculenta TaxID=4460 RepID=A0A843WNA9_COLES|nr:hypothetical protein [Colocasia esculenta]